MKAMSRYVRMKQWWRGREAELEAQLEVKEMTSTRLQKRILDLEAKEEKLRIVWGIITSMPDPALMRTVMVAWGEKGVKNPPVNS